MRSPHLSLRARWQPAGRRHRESRRLAAATRCSARIPRQLRLYENGHRSRLRRSSRPRAATVAPHGRASSQAPQEPRRALPAQFPRPEHRAVPQIAPKNWNYMPVCLIRCPGRTLRNRCGAPTTFQASDDAAQQGLRPRRLASCYSFTRQFEHTVARLTHLPGAELVKDLWVASALALRQPRNFSL